MSTTYWTWRPIGCFLIAVLTWCGSLPESMGNELAERIQPLLRHHCVRCHGPNDAKGGLNLSTSSGVARGGESGAAVVPGNLDASLLWSKVEAGEMPPDKPLDEDEQKLLRAWIASGANGLESAVVRGEHWAFQQLRRPDRPMLNTRDRVRTRIDEYVQVKLEAKQLAFSADADRRTLVRRVSFDLTGLPPSPEEVATFLQDARPDAYERMVDRYLQSPRFGERWGKHWLDLAGYADSNGYFSADTDRPLAYRYRDYVIRSINQDKPFDRFVCEQIAGDEMVAFTPGEPATPEIIERLIATHFLRNGQDGTDIGVQEPEAFEIDRRAALEASVQVTASALLGLTVHCARCHDHKFEPIRQKEYYQLQAILFPAFNPQDWVNPQDRIVHAYLPGEREVWQAEQQKIEAELLRCDEEFREWLREHREPSVELFREQFDAPVETSRWSDRAPGENGSDVHLEVVASGDGNHDVPRSGAHRKDQRLFLAAGDAEAFLVTRAAFDWTPEQTGDWVQVTFDLVRSQIHQEPAAERMGYLVACHDLDDSSADRAGNLLIDGNPQGATSVYLDYPGTDQRNLGAIGERSYQPGRNYGVRITREADGQLLLEHLCDGIPDGKSIKLNDADLPDGSFAFLLYPRRNFVVDNLRIEACDVKATTETQRAEIRKAREDRRAAYESQREAWKQRRQSQPGIPIAWVTDKSARQPEVPLLVRGLYHQRGELVTPSAIHALTNEANAYQVEAPVSANRTTGRRLGFARWLTEPNGPAAGLVARVHVNRIWRQYFGKGIVATTDNLGQSGAAASHPELLDYLAWELHHNEWQQKTIHRQIVCSTVYRQSAIANDAGWTIDPDNRWLWRFPLRRLEAELIRDAMLTVAGQLDETSFGPYIPTLQTPVGEVVVDPKTPGARRRSIYLQQRRSQSLSMLKVFDAPAIATICSARPSSTVPLQSLALLNSDFVLDCGKKLAQRLQREATGRDLAGIVDHAWEVVMGRPPTDQEAEMAVRFVREQQMLYQGPQAEFWAMSDLCHMLLASNSFLYLE